MWKKRGARREGAKEAVEEGLERGERGGAARRASATHLALHRGEQAGDCLRVNLRAAGLDDLLNVSRGGRGVAAQHGQKVGCEVLHRAAGDASGRGGRGRVSAG